MLGAILLNNEALKTATASLADSDFFLSTHRRIFERMVAMAEARKAIDLVTLTDELSARGELEGVGGAAYVAQLTGGVPRISKVPHYVSIVSEQAALRHLGCAGEAIALAALAPDAVVGDIEMRLREILTASALKRRGGLRAVEVGELLSMQIKPPEMVLDPVLPEQGLAMLYSKRGVGKTYIVLGMAHAVASGGRFLRWNAPKPRRVLYVDGELPAGTLQERLAAIIAGAEDGDAISLGSRLRLITPDIQVSPMPDLATREGQALIEREMEGVELLILDNLSALCRSGKENEGESWLPVQQWALSLRQRGVSVLFVHHAGKGGAQRGTSRREDLLDTVIALQHPRDYTPDEGLRCEAHFEKCRNFQGVDAKPFEVRLETGPDGAAAWTMRDIEDGQLARAAELFAEGLSVRSGLKGTAVFWGSRSVVGEPPKRRVAIEKFSDKGGGKDLRSASASVRLVRVEERDSVEVQLLHPGVGELHSRSVWDIRSLVPPPERNVLFEALKFFCGESKLKLLLGSPYEIKPKKLQPDAAFELHVAWLLGLFGLSTAVLGEYENIVAPETEVHRGSVDILAASQRRKNLVLVACTIGVPKEDDFTNLLNTAGIVAREVFAGTAVSVLPLVCTGVRGFAPYKDIVE